MIVLLLIINLIHLIKLATSKQHLTLVQALLTALIVKMLMVPLLVDVLNSSLHVQLSTATL